MSSGTIVGDMQGAIRERGERNEVGMIPEVIIPKMLNLHRLRVKTEKRKENDIPPSSLFPSSFFHLKSL